MACICQQSVAHCCAEAQRTSPKCGCHLSHGLTFQFERLLTFRGGSNACRLLLVDGMSALFRVHLSYQVGVATQDHFRLSCHCEVDDGDGRFCRLIRHRNTCKWQLRTPVFQMIGHYCSRMHICQFTALLLWIVICLYTLYAHGTFWSVGRSASLSDCWCRMRPGVQRAKATISRFYTVSS